MVEYMHPRRISAVLRHRVGRRGFFLLTLAVVDFIYGRSLVYPETEAQALSNRWLADVIPGLGQQESLWLWAITWWVVGALCAINSLLRSDVWAYSAAFALKVAWVAANAVAGLSGMPGAINRCLVWGFIAACVLMIASWPEPRNSLPEVFRDIEQSGEIPRMGSDDGDVEV